MVSPPEPGKLDVEILDQIGREGDSLRNPYGHLREQKV